MDQNTQGGTGCEKWSFALSSASMETGKQYGCAQTHKRSHTECLYLRIFGRQLISHSILFFFYIIPNFGLAICAERKSGRKKGPQANMLQSAS